MFALNVCNTQANEKYTLSVYAISHVRRVSHGENTCCSSVETCSRARSQYSVTVGVLRTDLFQGEQRNFDV